MAKPAHQSGNNREFRAQIKGFETLTTPEKLNKIKGLLEREKAELEKAQKQLSADAFAGKLRYTRRMEKRDQNDHDRLEIIEQLLERMGMEP